MSKLLSFNRADSESDNFVSAQCEMANETESMSNNVQDLPRSFLLHINLKEGRNLAVRDRCGKNQTILLC